RSTVRGGVGVVTMGNVVDGRTGERCANGASDPGPRHGCQINRSLRQAASRIELTGDGPTFEQSTAKSIDQPAPGDPHGRRVLQLGDDLMALIERRWPAVSVEVAPILRDETGSRRLNAVDSAQKCCGVIGRLGERVLGCCGEAVAKASPQLNLTGI